MTKKLRVLLLSVSALWLLTVLIGCAKTSSMAFDHRDYVELPKGTLIKDVPFWLNGADKAPTYTDYLTAEEGAYYSGAAQEVLKS